MPSPEPAIPPRVSHPAPSPEPGPDRDDDPNPPSSKPSTPPPIDPVKSDVPPSQSVPDGVQKPSSSSPPDGLASKPPATVVPPDPGDIIEMETFNQVLELDDGDESQAFSRSTVEDYLNQVNTTLVQMDQALDRNNLREMSALGHFLKGSSAALGVRKVQASCEQMQYIGLLRDEEENKVLSEQDATDKITVILARVKVEYAEAEAWLNGYFKLLANES